MSNPINGIRKVFKKVVKVVKKIALPVLAIGAVVLTGGAALGVLPSVGGLAGSLGLSSGLTSVLTTAAKAASFGALTSAVTGGNIVKGATQGFLAGGVLGGLGQIATKTANTVAATGTAGAATAAQTASSIDRALPPVQSAAGATPSMGMDSLALGRTAAAAPQVRGLGYGFEAAVPASAPAASSAAQVTEYAPVSKPASGGILGFFNQNPVVSGMALQGLGGGLMARSQARAAERERDRVEASYADTSGLFRLSDAAVGVAHPDANEKYDAAIYRGRVTYDARLGRYV